MAQILGRPGTVKKRRQQTLHSNERQRLHPPGGRSVPSQFIANDIVHDNRFFFMRGAFDKEVPQPQIREFRKTNAPDDQLLIAARSGDLETVAKLLKQGADKSKKNNAGKTAGDLATQRGHATVAELLW